MDPQAVQAGVVRFAVVAFYVERYCLVLNPARKHRGERRGTQGRGHGGEGINPTSLQANAEVTAYSAHMRGRGNFPLIHLLIAGIFAIDINHTVTRPSFALHTPQHSTGHRPQGPLLTESAALSSRLA